MGGLIKAATPPKVQSVATSTAVDTASEERQRRLDALERARAGRAGTITTSPRGMLVTAEWVPQRKSLLGE
ncbi:MAG: hypothetical protein IPK66_02730 [Rhodospirillales bacterium]|nr:hypothetical protein [Rhodospirillales bacterium]